ncbi:MAG: aminotransferase class I/II-fold pyridoxal phosphate-dependent enzyme, partial [Clostridia bacterium]|nr:aminotransferase class I/II-fold pyridoxal phosphate-dependent enzyme [Clostridia bacterium]
KIIIIDEAYAEFSNCSMANYITKYPNLLIIRTFSKSYSLAGARCGYAIGDEALINGLKTVKDSINSYTVDRLTEGIAIKALENNKYFNAQVDKIISTRDEYADKLREIGFDVLPSNANFLFAKHNDIKASELYYQLKKQGVLVRHFNQARIDDYLRITVGAENEMEALMKALNKIIADSKVNVKVEDSE